MFAGGSGGIHQFDNLVIKTIEPNIEDILDRSTVFVEQGTLVGDGPGNSADGRLNALKSMLEIAGDLIDSGYIEEADKIKAWKLGIKAFIPKPLTPLIMIKAIAKALSGEK